ncbi:Uncharacterised protein [Bordetella pertussis]|nr:Uncharacterised protein [Bordetella pertussis]
MRRWRNASWAASLATARVTMSSALMLLVPSHSSPVWASRTRRALIHSSM